MFWATLAVVLAKEKDIKGSGGISFVSVQFWRSIEPRGPFSNIRFTRVYADYVADGQFGPSWRVFHYFSATMEPL